MSDEEEREMMQRYVFEKYRATDASQIRDRLERFGVCVVPGVLSAEECAEMEDGAWNWLESVTRGFEVPWRRADDATWASFYKLSPMHSMLLQHWGVGHAQWVWNVRMNKRVGRVFEAVWRGRCGGGVGASASASADAENMLTSFDGVSLHLPHERTRRGFYRGATWLHTDQSYTRPGPECVQSWVTARDVCVGDATLAFFPGSHLLHAAFARRFGVTSKDDWYKLSGEQQQWYVEQQQQQTSGAGDGAVGGPEFMMCPRGSMVLWDSRTIHSGSEALRTRPRENFRVVVYVCLMPRQLLYGQKDKDKILRKRVRVFEEQRMTTHWPLKVKLFPKTPRLYSAAPPPVARTPAPVLTPYGRSLVGYARASSKNNT